MGARGPIPERESNLARPRERKGSDEQATKRGQLRDLTEDLFQEDPDWLPFTKKVWRAGHNTGMSDFYQDTDLAEMWFMCQELDRYIRPRTNTKTGEEYVKQSPEMVKAITTLMNNLGFDEASRRRVRIELDAPQEPKEDAQILAFELYSSDLDEAARANDDNDEEAADDAS